MHRFVSRLMRTTRTMRTQLERKTMSAYAIELLGIQHRYESDLVLRNVDLTIEQGEIFGFLGHTVARQPRADTGDLLRRR